MSRNRGFDAALTPGIFRSDSALKQDGEAPDSLGPCHDLKCVRDFELREFRVQLLALASALETPKSPGSGCC